MRMPVLTAAAAVTLLVSGAGVAAAAPPSAQTVDLMCDNGQQYQVAVNGNGQFTPGHVVGSTATLVPVWFGDNVFTVMEPGEEPYSFPADDDVAKGGGHPMAKINRDMLHCSFSQTFALTEEEAAQEGLPPGTVVTFEGSVIGFLSGRP